MTNSRRSRLGALFAACLVATTYGFALSGGGFSVVVIVPTLAMLFPLLGIVSPRFGRFGRRSLLCWILFSCSLLLAILVNTESYPAYGVSVTFALMHAIGLSGITFALLWAPTNLSFERLLTNIAYFLAPLIALGIYVALNDGGFAHRHRPLGLHPNWWGEVAFATGVSALAARRLGLRVLIIVMAIVLQVLVQSRGALVALVGATGAYVSLRMLQEGWRWYAALLGPALGLVLVLMVEFGSGPGGFAPWLYVRDDVMLWNDPYRGFGTGLSGRNDSWIEAWQAFSDNPIFGTGLDTLRGTHNGFLQVVGEGGLQLLLVITSMMLLTIVRSVKSGRLLITSIVIGYVLHVMTYPRMINMNIASIVFYLCMFSQISSQRLPIDRKRESMIRPGRVGGRISGGVQ